jgi:hypothetical protein
MATAFLWNNHLASCFIGDIGTAALSVLPLSNIQDPQPRLRARWVPATGVQIWADLGSSVEVSAVAFISTTLGMSGGTPTVRVQLSDDAAFGTATWDTGTYAVSTDDAAGGNVVLLHETSATGRYMRIDMDDAAASELDVGRIIAGPLWRCAYSYAYGMQEGRMILDRRDRNPHSGAEFPVPAVFNPRQASFSLPYVSTTEATAEWRTMLDTLGAVGDVLWIPDDTLSPTELNRRCIFGAALPPTESALLQRAGFRHHTRGFTITERV